MNVRVNLHFYEIVELLAKVRKRNKFEELALINYKKYRYINY